MRVLIDTNILIYREDAHVLPDKLGLLLRRMSEVRVVILVHPASRDDLLRDSDTGRREVSLSKLETYQELESPPEAAGDATFLSRIGPPSSGSERVDTELIYALYRNAVDLLITEDKELMRKAQRVGVDSLVLNIERGLEFFGPVAGQQITQPPPLYEMPAHNLDLKDPFFDPLKEEYPTFVQWFKRISAEGRKCWAFHENSKLGALLIYKMENESVECSPPLPTKLRLKICTFQVTSTGNKIGELFVKLSTRFALDNGCSEMYLTHFAKDKDWLVDLINEYGFAAVGKNKLGEDVFLKTLTVDRNFAAKLAPVQVSKKFYPVFCDGDRVRKFLIPIRPEYHERLFVDYKERQLTIPEFAGQFIVEGNTIKKAYLCHSRVRDLRPGDLALFYRSGDRQEITSIGVVEKTLHSLRSAAEVLRVVERRTVYSYDEINQMTERPMLVILFDFHTHLATPVASRELRQQGIHIPLSIERISHRDYLQIKQRGGVDGRITVD